MRRTNTFDVVPLCDNDEELLRRLLDASAALWNEINYERHQRYADPDSHVWDISDYRERYAGVLGAAIVQQIERQNAVAWRSSSVPRMTLIVSGSCPGVLHPVNRLSDEEDK